MGFGKTHKIYKFIFVVFMGFDHLYRFEVSHICITKGFQLFIVLVGFGFLYPLGVLALLYCALLKGFYILYMLKVSYF